MIVSSQEGGCYSVLVIAGKIAAVALTFAADLSGPMAAKVGRHRHGLEKQQWRP